MTWTAFSFFITCVSLTGYIYLYHLPGKEVFLNQLDGQHLIFSVIGYGLLFYVLSYIAIVTASLTFLIITELIATKPNEAIAYLPYELQKNLTSETNSDISSNYKSALEYLTNDVVGFNFIVSNWQVVLSMPASIFAAFLVAKIKGCKVKKYPKKYLALLRYLVQKHYGQLDEYIFDIAENIVETINVNNDVGSGPLILFTLSSRKVYIGYPIDFNIYQKEDYIKILPIISGYRKESNLTMELTTFYEDVFSLLLSEEIEGNQNNSDIDFVILLPVSEIVTISSFDPETYKHFQ